MNIKTLDKDILMNLAIWLGVNPKRIIDLNGIMPEKDNNYFKGILDSNTIDILEAFIRRLIHKAVKYINGNNRYNILNFIKRIRQFFRKDLVEISHCRFVELDRELRNKLSISSINWNGKRGVICLSHDIDSKEDYEYIAEIYEINKDFGLVSGFNFLTNWGYKIDRMLLQKLTDNGFEIGLHGYTHDIAIGFRSEKRIKRELSLALEKINFSIKGYRAPAFSVSYRLLKVLKELGIKYDSSMKTISCYSPQSAEVFYPYRYPGIGIWEVPLTIQDDRLFRDLHLSNEEALGVIKELASRIIEIGGVCVINNHPALVYKKRYYYSELIKWISSLKNTWVTTMGELIKFMEDREKNIYSDSNE